MNNVLPLAQNAISILQHYLKTLGFTPVLHFELEGCFELQPNQQPFQLSYQRINEQLKLHGIDGELVAEYWQNQWEYVSLFNGQSPLKEANNLANAMNILPELFKQQGIEKTIIKPVVWSGDKGKLAQGSGNIFTTDTRNVHIPNAVQINVSAKDSSGRNIVVEKGFGEFLQQCFLQTSLSCCLLYLPEEDAFERLALKHKYGLADELCSPVDISGGHQGSIALYKELGKHNQAMGESPLIYDHLNNVMVSQSNWQATARVEHRLGASSTRYNAHINIIFALLNLVDAIEVYIEGECENMLISEMKTQQLPQSLYDQNSGSSGDFSYKEGAISLFKKDVWFAQSLNRVVDKVLNKQPDDAVPFLESFNPVMKLGDELKQVFLEQYKQPELISLSENY